MKNFFEKYTEKPTSTFSRLFITFLFGFYHLQSFLGYWPLQELNPLALMERIIMDFLEY